MRLIMIMDIFYRPILKNWNTDGSKKTLFVEELCQKETLTVEMLKNGPLDP